MAWTKKRNVSARGAVVDVLSELATTEDDKTLDIGSDVGEDAVVEVLGVRIEFIADATAVIRSIAFEILDAGGDIIFGMEFDSATDIAASTTEILELIPNLGQAFITGTTPGTTGPHASFLPKLILGAGHQLRIFTSANATGGDSILIHIRLQHV